MPDTLPILPLTLEIIPFLKPERKVSRRLVTCPKSSQVNKKQRMALNLGLSFGSFYGQFTAPPPRMPPSRLQMVPVRGGSPFPLTLCLHFRDQVVFLLTWLEPPGRSGDLRRRVMMDQRKRKRQPILRGESAFHCEAG